MRRTWLHLVSYLSLAAFLVANQPAALIGFARCGNELPSQHSVECWHCACMQHEAEEPSHCDCEECCSEAVLDQSVEPSQPASAPHDHSSCPCCPCPGGCAY